MQKINYYLQYAKMLAQAAEQTSKPTLLLQACCAPCTSGMIEELVQYYDVTLYFYNPNIDTAEEYEFRAKELARLIGEMGLSDQVKLIVLGFESTPFDLISLGKEHLPERGARCALCYRLRLEQTAVYAKEHGFDLFCSTLSVSPLKSADLLNQIGSELEREYGVTWLISDFKKKDGYKRSVENSKRYDLYRQNYCGCRYSRQQAEKREHADAE